MHSRAYLLLKRDLDNLERIPIQGLSASPLSDDNLYKWSAKIEGLEDTVWEGGVFRLNITFSDEYDTVPPNVVFMAIPFHPNIHPDTGVPVSGLLDKAWSEDCNLQSLLLELQCLLSNPETDSGCVGNHEAARMYKDTPHTYRQLALDCVTASLRIEAGMSPYDSDVISRPHSQPLSSDSLVLLPPNTSPSTTKAQKVKAISFDDYHMFWKGLATSVPSNSTNRNDKALRLFHSKKRNTDSEQSHIDEIEKKMASHLTVKYGISNKPKSKPLVKEKEYRQKRIAQLMELYTSSKRDQDAIATDVATDATVEQRPVAEIDELLKWTNSLDETELNS